MKNFISILFIISLIPISAYSQFSPRDRYLNPDYRKEYHKEFTEIPENRKADAKKAFALLNEGISLYKQKKDNEAIEKYEEALELYPAPEIYYHYGNSLSNTGEMIYAARSYNFAIENGYTSPELAWYNMACVYSLDKKSEKAFAALKNAILSGYPVFEYILGDSDLKNFRSDSRWNSYAAELKKLFDRGNLQLPSGKKFNVGVASTNDAYTFCHDGKALLERNISEIRKHKLYGSWKFKNYNLTIEWNRETGEKGVGQPKYCAAVCEYKTYAPINNSINKKELIKWQEIEFQKDSHWKEIPFSGPCK
jgi:tetratricopeptide (TPR) repeat protein